MDGITREAILNFTSGEENQQMLAYILDPQNGKVVADAMSFIVTHLDLIEQFKLEHNVVQFLQQFLLIQGVLIDPVACQGRLRLVDLLLPWLQTV